MVNSHQVQEFLEARLMAHANPDAFRIARETLLSQNKREVLSHFESFLHSHSQDDEQRCQGIAGLTALYETEAVDTIVCWINDQSPVVRWVVCGCLHDFGDVRVVPALLERMKLDNDCQVRGEAASAIGQIGAVDALPDLYRTCLMDREFDQLGHSPSSAAIEAISAVLRKWVTQQMAETPSRRFQESTRQGQLTGIVTAESIPFDPERGLHRSERYAHMPNSAFGFSCSSKLGLQTTLAAPFEIEVGYVDPECRIHRIFIFRPHGDGTHGEWVIHTILPPSVLMHPPQC